MDKRTLGARITEARVAAQLTQQSLAEAIGMDRSALSKLEAGARKLDVSELLALASALDLPLAYFVNDAPQSVVSRRQDTQTNHDSAWALDTALRLFSADVLEMQRLGLLVPPESLPPLRTPNSHEDAEQAAQTVRTVAGLSSTPITDLGRACDRLGMLTLVNDFGTADGGFVIVDGASPPFGVAAVDGGSDTGRRRMTVAHELGHWVFGDAYDRGAKWDETMIRSFAVHFLAPRAAVTRDWHARSEWTIRDRALFIGATYRLSWSAAVNQLANLGLVTTAEYDSLNRNRPRRGDYLRLGLDLVDDFKPPYVSPAFTSAVLTGYEKQVLTPERSVELLRGTIGPDDLPERVLPPYEELMLSLSHHER